MLHPVTLTEHVFILKHCQSQQTIYNKWGLKKPAKCTKHHPCIWINIVLQLCVSCHESELSAPELHGALPSEVSCSAPRQQQPDRGRAGSLSARAAQVPSTKQPLALSPHLKSPCKVQWVEIHHTLPFKKSAEKPTQAEGGKNSGDQPTQPQHQTGKKARSYGGQSHNTTKSGSGD